MPVPGEHKTVQARILLHELMTAQTRVHDVDLLELGSDAEATKMAEGASNI